MTWCHVYHSFPDVNGKLHGAEGFAQGSSSLQILINSSIHITQPCMPLQGNARAAFSCDLEVKSKSALGNFPKMGNPGRYTANFLCIATSKQHGGMVAYRVLYQRCGVPQTAAAGCGRTPQPDYSLRQQRWPAPLAHMLAATTAHVYSKQKNCA